MAYYDSEGNWTLTWGDDPNNPPAPTGIPPADATPDVQAKVISDRSGQDYNSILYDINSSNAKQAAFDALKTTDPNAYYAQQAKNLSDSAFSAWSSNHTGAYWNVLSELDKIKDVNPSAYYNAKIDLLGSQMGWNHGQNTADRNSEYIQQIQAMLPDMVKSGISVDQINSKLGTSFAGASSANQQRIANEAANGGGGFSFSKDILPGLEFVGAASAAMLGGGALLGDFAAGGAAATPDAYMASAGLNPGTFSGAAFTMPEVAAAAPAYTSPTDYMSQAGLDAGNFTSPAFTVADTTPAYSSMNDYMSQAGINPNAQITPNYSSANDYMNQAGLDAGQFSGSNFQMPSTLSDIAKYANTASKALNATNSLAKMLSSTSAQNKNIAQGLGLSQLANTLRQSTPTNDYLGQIKGNQNPFLFNVPGQTQASEGMYDVSGANMANALRKA